MTGAPAPRWRVVTDGGSPVPFASEIGARTHAALRIARAGRVVALVEHFTDELGWHRCPGGEALHARESPEIRAARRPGLPPRRDGAHDHNE